MDILQSGWWNCVDNKTQIPHKTVYAWSHTLLSWVWRGWHARLQCEGEANSLLTEQLHVLDGQQSTETMTCPHSAGDGEFSLGNDTTTNHHRLCSNKIPYHQLFQSSMCTSKCDWVTVVRAMLRPFVYAFWYGISFDTHITNDTNELLTKLCACCMYAITVWNNVN